MCKNGGPGVCATIPLDGNFFHALLQIDLAIVHQVDRAGCPQCGGPLHRSDYTRKPRGGALAAAGEEHARRFSLCCGREGCRKRATPPSVRFLGRRVYLGAALLVACILRLTHPEPAELRRLTGIPAQTMERWSRWWRTIFPSTALFIVLKGRFFSPPDENLLPLSLLEHLHGSADERLTSMLKLLAPSTTTSVPDGDRFLRGV